MIGSQQLLFPSLAHTSSLAAEIHKVNVTTRVEITNRASSHTKLSTSGCFIASR